MRGHICERYTKNGGCKHCINPQFTSAKAEYRKIVGTLREKMVQRYFRVHPEDVGDFQLAVLSTVQSHEPSFDLQDIMAARKPRPGPRGYEIRCYWILPEDELFMRAIERAFEMTRGVIHVTPLVPE